MHLILTGDGRGGRCAWYHPCGARSVTLQVPSLYQAPLYEVPALYRLLCCEEGTLAPSEAGPGRPCRGLEWVGCVPGDYPSQVPTRSHTHPRYTPGTHHPKVGNLGAYTRSGTLVGEPRGVRTQPGFRVPGLVYTVFGIREGLHGRLTGFMTVLS